jgi:hypothetical protein
MPRIDQGAQRVRLDQVINHQRLPVQAAGPINHGRGGFRRCPARNRHHDVVYVLEGLWRALSSSTACAPMHALHGGVVVVE